MFSILTALALLGAADPESAAAPDAPPPPPIIAPEAPTVSNAPVGPQSLETNELDALHGRQGAVVIVASDQLLQATNSGNSVNANTVTTGALRIDANAFAGFNGIGNFVMNSGNNNNLQGAITINIVTTAPNP
ncbi:hypothetical protein D8I30_03375 [Brevundimonas naejangsanensis]|uniref:Holdfast attachment protein HfaA n=1 Tax=Brevundimonas naejangsanensis TaxID=588932 RepID=A0A494RDU8_9CAUL|nr:hypothetical protein [Brevundimonas naejangsanensis]AYG94331.1 hypothetical protein D8I30_03375 [Brevundimonas naejangsanensis]